MYWQSPDQRDRFDREWLDSHETSKANSFKEMLRKAHCIDKYIRMGWFDMCRDLQTFEWVESVRPVLTITSVFGLALILLQTRSLIKKNTVGKFYQVPGAMATAAAFLPLKTPTWMTPSQVFCNVS